MSGPRSHYTRIQDDEQSKVEISSRGIERKGSIPDSKEPEPEPDLEMGVEKLGSKKTPFDLKRLFAQAGPERNILIYATICLFLSAILSLAVPAFVGVIIDAISSSDPDNSEISNPTLKKIIDMFGMKNTATNVLTVATIILGILITLSALFSMLRGYLYTLAGERVVARLRKQVFEAVMRLEVAFFDVTRTGELVNRLSADTEVLKNAVTVNISMALRWAATVIGGILYLFLISWRLTLVVMGVVPFVAMTGRWYGEKIKQLSKETQDALARATEVAEESISSLRTVRAFYREPLQIEKYNAKIEDTYTLGARAAWLYGMFIGGIGLIGSAAIILVLWYGATLVLDGEMSSGTLTSFVLYTLTVAMALAGLTGLFGSLMKAVGANGRVFEIIDRAPAIPLAGGREIDRFQGHVVFKNVTFRYPSRVQSLVLAGVSLELRPGTVTALVGPSGGGKTTVVSLIERYYDVRDEEGSILLDGINIKEIDPSWLHRRIGYVSQEPVLFATTIRENVCYGVESATDEDIRKACAMANAAGFIEGFPDKYDTLVGERGVRLSGGQKQRIAIARAILMNPVILIADEATSALDAESEYHVQQALDRLMVGRTVLVVAHRLSTVKNADNVIVIEQGKIAEQGKHAELLERSGTYAKLVRRQLTEGPAAADFAGDREQSEVGRRHPSRPVEAEARD